MTVFIANLKVLSLQNHHWMTAQIRYRRIINLKYSSVNHPTSQYMNKIQIFPQNSSTKSRNHSITQNSRKKRLASRVTFTQSSMQGWHCGLRKSHAKSNKKITWKMLVSWYYAKTQRKIMYGKPKNKVRKTK